ncbi:tetratricopeptide repeat protein [Epilithonimonas mollis]|uniref:Tetratricopeptide repeat-containing protein n=1 Tax=Epilithonimonas mollis TaxID=216903 RepID=A0A1M6U8K1_9FLAO|nr:tetratricopeptide repeat protein [Epilithonimonas mollis]SHK65480.1 Tetratricopeptide repeat-containing protein [Epilithonimonas mollis]
MKTEFKIKSLLFGLSFIAANYMTAQTNQTSNDTINNQTAATAQTSGVSNPEIEGLKQKIAAKPDDTQSLVGLATAYQNASDWTSAIATWNKVTAIIPDWAPAYYSIGYANQSAKNNDGAKMAYEQYIAKVKPEEVDANKQNLAYAYFFIAFLDKESNPEKAKQYIAKSLQYDSSNQDALNLSKSLMN